MNKPTIEEIIAFARDCREGAVSKILPVGDEQWLSFEVVELANAERLKKYLSSKYGTWIYVSMSSLFRSHHSLSISFREEEAEKCSDCGWLEGWHSEYCKYSVYLKKKDRAIAGELVIRLEDAKVVPVSDIGSYRNIHGDGLVDVLLEDRSVLVGINLRNLFVARPDSE